MSSFNLITLLFGFPETKYKRKVSSEVNATSTPEITTKPSEASDLPSATAKESTFISTTLETAADPSSIVGRGRPAKSQFALWHAPDASWKSHILHDLLTPFRIAIYPIILWTAFVVGGTININLFFVLTESEVLSNPPYNWPPSSVGFANFASYVFPSPPSSRRPGFVWSSH